MHGVRLDVRTLSSARTVQFTRFFLADERWEGIDHEVAIAESSSRAR